MTAQNGPNGIRSQSPGLHGFASLYGEHKGLQTSQPCCPRQCCPKVARRCGKCLWCPRAPQRQPLKSHVGKSVHEGRGRAKQGALNRMPETAKALETPRQQMPGEKSIHTPVKPTRSKQRSRRAAHPSRTTWAKTNDKSITSRQRHTQKRVDQNSSFTSKDQRNGRFIEN
jgi:hypothetical protein